MSNVIDRHEAKCDFSIAMRVFWKTGKHQWFANKQDTVKLTIKTLSDAAQGLKVHLFVLLDAPDHLREAYEDLILNNWHSDIKPTFIFAPNETNYSIFQRQYDLLVQQDESEFCAMLEDDYCWLPNALTEIKRLFDEHPEVDFATGYDHGEYYSKWWQQIPSSFLESRRLPIWRKVAGTTSTCFARRSALKECVIPMRAYNHKLLFYPLHATDAMVWYSITKTGVFNPFYFLRCIWERRLYLLWAVTLAWVLCWKHLLFRPKRCLWASIPALCTHMNQESLPPSIDWEQFGKKPEGN
jgi:hypothetical protein